MWTFLKDALKKYSVQGMAAAATLQAVYMAMPATIQQYSPDWLTHTMVLVFLAYGLIGRFIPQGTPADPAK